MICTVGLVCLDIINFMPEYPIEDSDLRCAEQSWERGGNASNSSTVLSCLGSPVECFGTLANDRALGFLQDDMNSLNIKHSNCPIIDCGTGPISVVLCSQQSGSRTIVHAKGKLPELTLHDFMKLNLKDYSWMHFEGRNDFELPRMMKYVRAYNQKNCKTIPSRPSNFPNYKRAVLPVSLELELQMENADVMLPLADVVFVGKDYARSLGAKDSTDAARMISGKVIPGTVVVCPWGDQGASYCITTASSTQDIDIKHQKAYVPDKVVDSLGAGDTFNGTVLHCLNKGLDVETSVDFACLVASAKLQIRGLKGLKDVLPEHPELLL